MSFKVKIRFEDITYGSKEPTELEAILTATDLMNKGYRRTSNAYCLVSRIDREDWLDILARERYCSRADFYNVDGSGIGASHKDFYVRVHSKDNHTVHPTVLKHIPAYR